MRVSGVEILSYLKRNLGIIVKHLEETGVLAYTVGKDHVFKPQIQVPDQAIEVPIKGFLYRIRVHQNSAPCKMNLDRPIQPTEYTVIHPGVIKIIGRIAEKIYLQAPSGHQSLVDLEVLKLAV